MLFEKSMLNQTMYTKNDHSNKLRALDDLLGYSGQCCPIILNLKATIYHKKSIKYKYLCITTNQ